MYFPVPSAHLALVTDPCDPSVAVLHPSPPISPRWESAVMTTGAAAAPRTTGNMAAGSLCSELEMASCGSGSFFFFNIPLEKR